MRPKISPAKPCTASAFQRFHFFRCAPYLGFEQTTYRTIYAEIPYDMVDIDGSSAWVAMYNTAEIRKISLADGSTISSIDTKEFSAKKVEEVTDAE